MLPVGAFTHSGDLRAAVGKVRLERQNQLCAVCSLLTQAGSQQADLHRVAQCQASRDLQCDQPAMLGNLRQWSLPMKKQARPSPALTPAQWAAFEQFVGQNKSAFRRIAYGTRGEYEPGDIETEALLLALKLSDSQDLPINFDDAAYRSTLLGRLYQRLTKYSCSPTKFAVRLDQGIGENEDQPHPLANTLASDGGRDPLALLIDRESAVFAHIRSANHFSLAAAYVRLLECFNYHLLAVADHLLITVSQTQAHLRYAGLLARHQEPLSLPMPSKAFVPGPWRKFRLMRIPEQLRLDFEDQEGLNFQLA